MSVTGSYRIKRLNVLNSHQSEPLKDVGVLIVRSIVHVLVRILKFPGSF